MKKKCCFIFLIMMVCFSACSGGQETSAEGSFVLYYKNAAETNLVAVPYEIEAETTEGQIDELLAALEVSPDDQTLKKVKPDDVLINEHFFGEDGQLILNFDSAYTNIEAITEVFCRAAIVKTLCQIEGVDYIEFYVNGQTLMLGGEIPIGQMESSDFIDNTGKDTSFVQTTDITVYFSDATGEMLNDVRLVVESSGSKSIEQLVTEQLILGPPEDAADVYPVVPEGTVLNRVTTRDGTCYVDLSSEFMNKREEITADVAVYSIVNSLCELPSVSKVQFTIDGEARKNYQDLDLTIVFERKLELMKE